MSNYPIFLNLAHFNCLVVGGGKVAARKVAHLIEAGAKPSIITIELSDELKSYVQQYQLSVQQKSVELTDIDGFQLIIAATNDKALNDAIAQQAIDLKLLVNNVTNAALCTFQMPAVVRRQGIELAIGTGGELPYVSHRLKKHIEELFTCEKMEALNKIASIRKEILTKAQGNSNCRKELLDAELAPLVDEFIQKLFSQIQN